MEFRNGIEKYETNVYTVKSVEYIRGCLHTLAELNQPDSNLAYEYEIIALDHTEDVINSIKARFYIFENQQIELHDISKEIFIDIVKKWFYGNGELYKLKKDERYQVNQIHYFYSLLQQILNVHQILKVENLKSEKEKVHLELGVDYDYFILKCLDENYILYFTFWD